MNTYKAILDTRRPNGVIANITQFDNATLELQIVTNGEIGDAWNQPQFELVAMKRDQQAVRESNQDAFTIVDCSEHRVTLELKEQFLTCRGSVKMQLIVKDGDRLSTSVFYVMIGESLDHGIVESHRDVAVLDELEEYVKSGYDDLAHQEQRMKDVEKATHELNELMVGNEAERQEAESKRQALFEGNEGQRQNTFNQQLTSQRREFEDSQADREGVFNDLKQNMSSEFNAAQNEREREFDTMMSSNQAQFDSAMSSNQAQFNHAESARATTFSNRQIENERTFTANENARQTVFNANEAGRKTNETDRVANENTRKNNETGRVAAESKRQQKMSEFEAKATQLSDELDAQVARVDAFVSANEEKLLGDRDKVDYMGNTHESVKAASDANVDWLLGEVNTVHYEGQHITATDTIEGRAKSAILKGNTLVNEMTLVETVDKIATYKANYALKSGSVYTLILPNIGSNKKISVDFFNYSTGKFKRYFYTTSRKTVFTAQEDDFLKNLVAMDGASVNDCLNAILLEGDYTNIDVPYFEGMASVKMPVLKTVGKNLFDGEIAFENVRVATSTGLTYPSEGYGISKLIEVKPNTTYFIQSGIISYFVFWDNNKKYIQGGGSRSVITTPSNAKYVRFDFEINNVDNVQFEESSVATSYESYKSNILMVNEEVELGKINNVEDELNLLTGELTQRTHEITLDVTDVQVFEGDSSDRFEVTSTVFPLNNQYIVGDYSGTSNWGLYVVNNYNHNIINTVCYHANAWKFYIRLKKGMYTAESLKQKLNENPLTIRYTLDTPIVKTVDLSDNAVYSYNEVTHYDCSSEAGSLIPTLSVDVPTNLSALVSRQRATIETLETENRALKEGQVELELGHEQQEEEIISTQDAVNFLLFDVLNVATYHVGEKEYDRMAVYIANQIIREKVTYQLAVSKYPQFITDIDEILVNEGHGDLIVKID